MSDFTENPVESTEELQVKKPFNKKKAIIASVVAGVLVIAGLVGVNAFRSKPEVRLATALSSVFTDNDIQFVFYLNASPELLAATGMTDADVQAFGRPGFNSLDDVSTSLAGLFLNVQNKDLSKSDDKISSEFKLVYNSHSIIDLRLIDRTLYLKSEFTSLDQTNPKLVSRDEISGVISLLSAYKSLVPQLSGAIDQLLLGKNLSVNFEKGTSLGDAFDEFIKTSQDSGIDSDFLDEFNSANSSAIRNSATITYLGFPNKGDGMDDHEIFELSIDTANYLREMQNPIKRIMETNIDVFGVSPSTSDFKQAIKSLEGKNLSLRITLIDNRLYSIMLDLTEIVAPGKGLPAWSGWVWFSVGDSRIRIPHRSYDITQDLLSLGLI